MTDQTTKPGHANDKDKLNKDLNKQQQNPNNRNNQDGAAKTHTDFDKNKPNNSKE